MIEAIAVRSKAAEPIVVNVLPLSNVTVAKFVAARKAAGPIVVTVFGTLIAVTPEPSKEEYAIEVVPLGIVTDPTQLVLLTTTLFVIVAYPLVEQGRLPLPADAMAEVALKLESAMVRETTTRSDRFLNEYCFTVN